MHELSYCEAVVEAVEARAAGRPVARVGVRVGTVHRVVPDAFEMSFQIASAGGVAEGATTDVVVVPIQVKCGDCGASYESDDPPPSCRICGGLDLSTSGGDEVILEWIEYKAATESAEHDPQIVPEHTHEPPVGAGGHSFNRGGI